MRKGTGLVRRGEFLRLGSRLTRGRCRRLRPRLVHARPRPAADAIDHHRLPHSPTALATPAREEPQPDRGSARAAEAPTPLPRACQLTDDVSAPLSSRRLVSLLRRAGVEAPGDEQSGYAHAWRWKERRGGERNIATTLPAPFLPAAPAKPPAPCLAGRTSARPPIASTCQLCIPCGAAPEAACATAV